MDEPTLSRPEWWLRVALLLHDGGRRELGSDPKRGILSSSDVAGRESRWVVSWSLFQACISDSDLDSSWWHFGWLWKREGGLNELESENFWILVLQVGSVNILKIWLIWWGGGFFSP